MKTIRRISTVIIGLALCALCTFSAFAEDVRYHIDELGMSISFPSEMSVTTRETPSASLEENVYLEAADTTGELQIYVSMEKTETSKDIYTSEDLASVKDTLMEDPMYKSSSEATYGGVVFLEFTIEDNTGSTNSYGFQSLTLINGMKIYINSISVGDMFTRDELNLIQNSLNSIEFDIVNEAAAKKAGCTAGAWIIVILLIIVLIFFVVAYSLGKKIKKQNLQKKRRIERKRKENYDVLDSAERTTKRPQNTLSGYRTSGDYFEEGFDERPQPTTKETPARERKTQKMNPVVDFLKTLSLGFKALFTRFGYFFKNLSRSLKGNKKKSKSKKRTKKRSRQARRGASKEYDVFRDK